MVFIFSKYLGVFMKISGQFTHWLDPTLYFQETETCLELVKKNGFLWEFFGSHNWGYQEMNPHYGHGWVPVPNSCHRTVFFPHLWTSSLRVLVQVTTIYPILPHSIDSSPMRTSSPGALVGRSRDGSWSVQLRTHVLLWLYCCVHSLNWPDFGPSHAHSPWQLLDIGF